ncbi:hypothetical protein [Nocardia sp. NPDC050406]|uniref:hypothetical protein n=1 Tax=Nocardia sp. NPDC050406 TaxID=3364318 RepID=UPI003794559A
MASSPSNSRLIFRLTRGQVVWAVVGAGVLVAVAVMARGNLHTIYKVQPDFVLGCALAISTFCFTRAFSRNGVDIALDLIREGTVPEIAAALDQVHQDKLHRDGVHEQVALLIRNLVAATSRAVEYFDLQTRSPRFYLSAPHIMVVMQDLDDAMFNASQIGLAVGSRESQLPCYPLPEQARHLLRDSLRDLHEAVARRNETYEALAAQFDTPREDELWGAFTVMTSDSFKALRDLEALLGKYIHSPPKDQIAVLQGYVAAARSRARTVEEMTITRPDLVLPPALTILLEDLETVEEKLRLASEAIEGAHA